MEDQKEKVNEKKGEIIKKGPFQLKHTWRDQKGYLFDISLSPDGKKLASTCGYNEFDIYEISTENLLKNVVLESPAINDSLIFVFFHPTDSNRIFCGTFGKGITEWDASGNFIRSFEDDISVNICGRAISRDGSFIATGHGCGPITLWDTSSGKHLWQNDEQGQTICLAFSPDGKTIASGSNDKSLKLWDAKNGALIRKLDGHTCHVISVEFSPDGTKIATAGSSGDKTVRVWDTISWKTIKVLKGHTDGLRCVKFSPDGKKILSGSSDKTIRVWDEATGKEVEKIDAHTSEVRCIVIYEGGVGMISGACDCKIKFWERSDGPEPSGDSCKIF